MKTKDKCPVCYGEEIVFVEQYEFPCPKCGEVKNMDVLTKEQKEYIQMKESLGNMYLSSKKHICLPVLKTQRANVNYAVEHDFYVFIEILEGKHNDFLQSIIDKTK